MKRILLHLSSDYGLFIRAVSGSMISNIIALLVAMLGSILLARALGPEGRGVVAWIMALSALAMEVVFFGMGRTARCIVAEDPSKTPTITMISIILILVGSLIMLPCFMLYGLHHEIGDQNKWIVFLGILSAPIVAFTMTMREILIGLHMKKQFNLQIILQKIINSGLLVVIVLLGIATPLLAVGAYLISFTIQLLCVLFVLRNFILTKTIDLKNSLEQLKSYIFYNYVSDLSFVLTATLPSLMLTSLYSIKAAGLYAAAMVIIEASRTSLRMIGMHILPKLASEKDHLRRKKLVKQALFLTLVLGVMGCLFLVMIGDWLLLLLYGDAFYDAITPFRIMAVGMLFFGLFGTSHAIIGAYTKGSSLVVASIAMTITMFGLCFLFIPIYGASGAAYAYSTSGFIGTVISFIVLFRLTRA